MLPTRIGTHPNNGIVDSHFSTKCKLYVDETAFFFVLLGACNLLSSNDICTCWAIKFQLLLALFCFCFTLLTLNLGQVPMLAIARDSVYSFNIQP